MIRREFLACIGIAITAIAAAAPQERLADIVLLVDGML